MHNLLAGRRVLVVEDEMLILMMIEDMLCELGCGSIVTAASTQQALAKIEEHAFDVAMLDSNLNGESSDLVADALTARGVPFFFATGHRNGGADSGYPDRFVLKKPFSLEDVLESFRQVLPTKNG
jgi:CheY-like chemotaxis protein